MTTREELVGLADWLSEQQNFHDSSVARNDLFIQTHIARLRQWGEHVRLASRQEVTVEELACSILDAQPGHSPDIARALLAKYSITKRTTEG